MDQRVAIVFGGSSGIGEATARALVTNGARVTIAGRDAAKLAAAAGRIEGVQTAVADARDRDAVARVFDATGPVDDVVICVTGGKGAGAFRDLDLDELRGALEAKTLAQLRVAQIAARHIRPGGSITFVTAASPRSVIRGTAGLAVVNGGLEAAIPILAVELAPIRVNAVSPGIIATPWWDAMPAGTKDSLFATAAASLPVGRVGQPDEVAAVIALIVRSGFVTGSIYEVDGGSHLVSQ
jgi:NAD(P)-dependent dehydrogenase (short-subunit alcohol dehydrogenase family)